MRILEHINQAYSESKKLLAILIDPDKTKGDEARRLATRLQEYSAHIDYILVGGSTVTNGDCEACVIEIKKYCNIPILLFPGDHSQLTAAADGLLYLSLLSGDNPEYIIGQHIASARAVAASDLEIIPTGYILIDGKNDSAVARVTKTSPLSQEDPTRIVNTALAGELQGKKLIYLEAGSGAKTPVHHEIIEQTVIQLSIPIIAGGGIRSNAGIQAAWNAGATMVVIGTAIEENIEQLKTLTQHGNIR